MMQLELNHIMLMTKTDTLLNGDFAPGILYVYLKYNLSIPNTQQADTYNNTVYFVLNRSA